VSGEERTCRWHTYDSHSDEIQAHQTDARERRRETGKAEMCARN
jgi:hypothetical protein